MARLALGALAHVIALTSRALSAAAALECCKAERLALELDMRRALGDLLNQILNLRTRDAFNFQIALVPSVARRIPGRLPRRLPLPFRIIVVRVGQALVLGAIVIVTSTALSSLVRQLSSLDVLQGVFHIVDAVFELSGCENCVRKALWRQTRRQVAFCSRLAGRTPAGKPIRKIYRRRIRG